MKTRVGDLRNIIREEFLNGVPEWELRQDTSKFVEAIRGKIERYILLNKSETGVERAEAIKSMNDTCDILEDKLYGVLEDSLYGFTRRI